MDQAVEKELSLFSVTLVDGRTRITRKHAVEVFVDVIAILGLKRVAEIYPNMVTKEPQGKMVEKQRGDYFVCFDDGSTAVMGDRLRTLARKIGTDLTVHWSA